MFLSQIFRQFRPNLQSLSKASLTSCFPLVTVDTPELKPRISTHYFQSTIVSTITRNANTSAKPFKILGLQQVAVGSTDAHSMNILWVETLGLEKIGSYTSEKENVAEDILKLGTDENGSVSVEIDLMCPLDEEKSPKVHKPPLNHIGLWVDDLESAVRWMESNGVRFAPGGIRKGAAGHDVTFIHPKGNETAPIGGCGVLIELVQAPKDVIKKLK